MSTKTFGPFLWPTLYNCASCCCCCCYLDDGIVLVLRSLSAFFGVIARLTCTKCQLATPNHAQLYNPPSPFALIPSSFFFLFLTILLCYTSKDIHTQTHTNRIKAFRCTMRQPLGRATSPQCSQSNNNVASSSVRPLAAPPSPPPPSSSASTTPRSWPSSSFVGLHIVWVKNHLKFGVSCRQHQKLVATCLMPPAACHTLTARNTLTNFETTYFCQEFVHLRVQYFFLAFQKDIL